MPAPHRSIFVAALWLALFVVPQAAGADAIIVSRAMLANTIAEFFIEPDRVRVELEIGAGDVAAFRNLLPDEVYARSGGPDLPQTERLHQFCTLELALRVDGELLACSLDAIGPRSRVRRDEVTGEPVPASEGAEPETVVAAELSYAMPGGAKRVTIETRLAARASIGFVAWHGGIPVNDFRYLAPIQTVLLDPEDPWYTRFEQRPLQRRYAAPMSGFLYVEPYEVRKEIVARPFDLQRFVDLGLEGRGTIPVEMQPELLRRAGAFLREHHEVVIDGKHIEPELARINFLERTLRTSRVIDPPVPQDVYAAMLGAIFVYRLDEPLPQRATMEWDLWDERITRIPASSVDQAGPLFTYLDPESPTLEWQNFLRFPELPTLELIAAPPTDLARALSVARWGLLALAVGLAIGWGRSRQPGLAVAAGVVTLACAASFWASRDAGLSQARAETVVAGLLHNVYRAFDFRGEEEIYDVLDKSVAGDLLADVYLEVRRGLELASQGGARAKVKDLELTELEAEPAEGGAFAATAAWQVRGSVGHWGHIHERRNAYRAKLEVAPVDGNWKLRRLEILERERLQGAASAGSAGKPAG